MYDNTWHTDKQSRGVFYYERPDKGRIDIIPVKIPKGARSRKINPETKQPYTLKPDEAQKWVCDGSSIWQINVPEKAAENYEIPAKNRGENIMDGPLPFMFGMPADQALERFELAFNPRQNPKTKNSQVWLIIKPRWKSDAANWSLAKVYLNKQNNYLPSAVQLVDPSGNMETVYQFKNLQVNKRTIDFLFIFGQKDPFKPNLKGYKLTLHNEDHPPVPFTVGLSAKKAKEIVEDKNLGFKASFKRGPPAPKKDLTYKVFEQDPKPGTPLAKGQTVILTVYDKPANEQKKPQQRR